jgi:hypothetical protein
VSKRELGKFGVWAVIGGAGVFVGENFVPQLKTFSPYVKYLVIGGAALIVLGMFA